MKRHIPWLYVFFSLVFVLCMPGPWLGAALSTDLVSRPGVYSGYAPLLYDEWVRSSQYVDVRDGTKLAVDIYRPAVGGVAVDTPYPALFNFTPYRRAAYRAGKLALSNEGMAELTKYGYVIIIGDVRGKGASYGKRTSMAHISEGRDAHDIIEWTAAQKWCSGHVGMFGSSANAHTILTAAATTPPSLKALFPEVTEYDLYDGWMRGGMHRTTGGGGEQQDDLATAPVDEDVLDENNNGIKDMLEVAVAQHVDNTPIFRCWRRCPTETASAGLIQMSADSGLIALSAGTPIFSGNPILPSTMRGDGMTFLPGIPCWPSSMRGRNMRNCSCTPVGISSVLTGAWTFRWSGTGFSIIG